MGAGVWVFVLTTWTAQTDFLEQGKEKGFQWKTGKPLITITLEDGISIKDPSVVQFEDRWHLFGTVRGRERSHGIVYLNFKDWKDSGQAKQSMLTNHDGFFCAPQVFYFTPHQKWYLICQASHPDWDPEYQPAFCTSTNLEDPKSWSKLEPMFGRKPEGINAWLDFWVICDQKHAYLFFTSLDGKMWRSRTPLDEFPIGWSDPVVALEGDIFEASHTYHDQETGDYLTIIEAQNGHGWRYFKAYRSSKLDGDWSPLADTKEHSFASMKNVKQPDPRWTDSISHGEILRSGHDEKLEISTKQLRLVFQGVLEKDRAGKNYGKIPWKLGLLEYSSPGK